MASAQILRPIEAVLGSIYEARNVPQSPTQRQHGASGHVFSSATVEIDDAYAHE